MGRPGSHPAQGKGPQGAPTLFTDASTRKASTVRQQQLHQRMEDRRKQKRLATARSCDKAPAKRFLLRQLRQLVGGLCLMHPRLLARIANTARSLSQSRLKVASELERFS